MISAILLAAGKSKRMGKENKLVKDLKGIPLIKHAVRGILDSSINELVVVLGYQEELVKKNIDTNKKIKFVYNKNFENGISSSIKIGLENLSIETESFFICLGDMPNISHNIYNKLINFQNNNEIVIPTYKGKRGNPILFSKSIKNILMEMKGDIGAKKIIDKQNKKILELETNDKGVTQNFNTKDNFKILK